MSDVWNVRHEHHNLPITAISYDSDTGETPIILVNDAQSHPSVVQAVKALRKSRTQMLLLPNLHLLADVIRRLITDCPVTITALSAVITGGGVMSAMPSMVADPTPAVVRQAPVRELSPLGVVTRRTPATGRLPRPSPTSAGTRQAGPSDLAPTAGGEAAASASIQEPAPPRPTSLPTPRESLKAQPPVTREPKLMDEAELLIELRP